MLPNFKQIKKDASASFFAYKTKEKENNKEKREGKSMKTYCHPCMEMLVYVSDVLMVSDENETPKDHVDIGNLAICDIESI